jgi:hypothetical protein
MGPWSRWKLLLDSPLTAGQRRRLVDWYGPGWFEEHEEGGMDFYHARGGLGQWCVARNRGRDYLFACAELGTYGPIKALAGLPAENQEHHWGTSTGAPGSQAKQRLKELFCPASAQWRRSALSRGLDLVERAITDWK